jgi:hypothetical protein
VSWLFLRRSSGWLTYSFGNGNQAGKVSFATQSTTADQPAFANLAKAFTIRSRTLAPRGTIFYTQPCLRGGNSFGRDISGGVGFIRPSFFCAPMTITDDNFNHRPAETTARPETKC